MTCDIVDVPPRRSHSEEDQKRREAVIRERLAEAICEEIGHPALCYAYNCYYDLPMTPMTFRELRGVLINILKQIANGARVTIPPYLNLFGFPDFVAIDLEEQELVLGIRALYNLEFRGVRDDTAIIHPGGRKIDFDVYGEEDREGLALVYLNQRLLEIFILN